MNDSLRRARIRVGLWVLGSAVGFVFGGWSNGHEFSVHLGFLLFGAYVMNEAWGDD